MKGYIKLVVIMAVLSYGFAMTSCNACAKCTEPSTGYTDEFCGKKVSAESYAKTLRAQGWNCTVD